MRPDPQSESHFIIAAVLDSEQAAAMLLALLALGGLVGMLLFADTGPIPGPHSIEELAVTEACPTYRIDLNSALAWELSLIPGIGEKKAAALVDYRDKAGPFRTWQDVERIVGFGPVLTEQLRSHARPISGSE